MGHRHRGTPTFTFSTGCTYKKLLGTSASLLVTSALLVVTRSYKETSALLRLMFAAETLVVHEVHEVRW